MKIKKIFNYNILKINKVETMFVNHAKINVVIKIMNDKNEQFSIEKKNYKYQKKSTIILKNIMMIHCKII